MPNWLPTWAPFAFLLLVVLPGALWLAHDLYRDAHLQEYADSRESRERALRLIDGQGPPVVGMKR